MVMAYVKRIIPLPIKRLFKKRELIHLGYMARRFLRRRRYSDTAATLRQSVPVFDSAVELTSGKDLGRIERQGFDCREGEHAVYLAREADIARINPELLERYPRPFGVKLIKASEISPDGTPYYTSAKIGSSSTPITMRAVGSIREKVAISNILSLHGVAPRVYDVIELRSGTATVFAMIVQHINGPTVRGPRAEAFFARFKQALEAESIDILGLIPGSKHVDFEAPDYHDNIVEDAGGMYYVDIQNFAILDPAARNRKLSETVSETTHFGDTRSFRTKRYAYQSVPGLSLEGKRDSLFRVSKIHEFLTTHGIDLGRGAVLDVGCNLGTLLMHALSRGAHWCVGLDTPEITGVARQYLFDQGYSRFDLRACDLREDSTLDVLPLKKFHFVFYMSIERHIGFPAWLQGLELSTMLYEGHQGETVEDIEKKAEAWSRPTKILARQTLQDGDSDPRPMLLLRLG
jgi:hypothetical protein